MTLQYYQLKNIHRRIDSLEQTLSDCAKYHELEELKQLFQTETRKIREEIEQINEKFKLL